MPRSQTLETYSGFYLTVFLSFSLFFSKTVVTFPNTCPTSFTILHHWGFFSFPLSLIDSWNWSVNQCLGSIINAYYSAWMCKSHFWVQTGCDRRMQEGVPLSPLDCYKSRPTFSFNFKV